MVNLQNLGFNRVYLDVWNQGTVFFNSPTMMATGLASGDDRLGWATQNCSDFTGDIFAWFEYGLIAAYGSVSSNSFAGYAEAQGWLLGQEGSGFVWMDVKTDALAFLTNITVDAVRGYPNLAGVQLDDHFAQPVSLQPSSASRSEQVLWMTNGAQALSNAVKTAIAETSSHAILSLSPTTLQQALSAFAVDWRAWAAGESPLFNEIVPQLYRSSYADFAPLFNETLENLYGAPSPVTAACAIAIGLRCDGSGDSTPWNDLEKMLDATMTAPPTLAPYGAPSPCVWYSRGALETYPDEFASYFQSISDA